MPLNPKCISCSGSSATLRTALTDLDTDIAAAVVTAQATTGVLLNQITIVPLGTIYDVTNSLYVCSAAVLYSTS